MIFYKERLAELIKAWDRRSQDVADGLGHKVQYVSALVRGTKKHLHDTGRCDRRCCLGRYNTSHTRAVSSPNYTG